MSSHYLVPPRVSSLENPMDGGAWKAAVHWVVKSQTLLSDFTSTFSASICCEVIGPGAMILGCFFFLAVLVLHCCAGFSLVAVSGDCSLVVVRQLLIAGEGNGNPLQCSCLENPRDGGAWWAAISGVTQSWTLLKRRSSSSSTRKKMLLIKK